MKKKGMKETRIRTTEASSRFIKSNNSFIFILDRKRVIPSG